MNVGRAYGRCLFLASFIHQFPEQSYDIGTAFRILPLSLIFVGMITFNNLCLKFAFR